MIKTITSRKDLAFSTVGMLLCFLTAIGAEELTRKAGGDTHESPEQSERQWTPALFDVMSFGHMPTAVDWLLIRFLAEDPSTAAVPKGMHPQAYYDLDLATQLDPAFFDLYRTGANLLGVVRSDGIGARELLVRGIDFAQKGITAYPVGFQERYWSNGWALPLILAYTDLFELDDMKGAAQAFLLASSAPGAPKYLNTLVNRLKSADGVYDVASRLLKYQLQTAPSDQVRDKLGRRQRTLVIQYSLHRLNRGLDEALARRKASWAKLNTLQRTEVFEEVRRTPTPDWEPKGLRGKIEVAETGRIVPTFAFTPILGLE